MFGYGIQAGSSGDGDANHVIKLQGKRLVDDGPLEALADGIRLGPKSSAAEWTKLATAVADELDKRSVHPLGIDAPLTLSEEGTKSGRPFEGLVQESLVTLVTDPDTLLPREVTMSKRVEGTLVADGETQSNLEAFKPFIEHRAIDVLQGDMNHFGFEGILTEADWAQAAGIQVAPLYQGPRGVRGNIYAEIVNAPGDTAQFLRPVLQCFRLKIMHEDGPAEGRATEADVVAAAHGDAPQRRGRAGAAEVGRRHQGAPA